MEKTWYLYRQKGHIGPFSLEEIEKFIASVPHEKKFYLWKEGESHWKVYQNPFATSFHEPPPLPDMPEEEAEGPPPLPREVLLDLVEIPLELPLGLQEEIKKSSAFRRPTTWWWIAVASGIILASGLGHYSYRKGYFFPKSDWGSSFAGNLLKGRPPFSLQDLSFSDYQRLKRVRTYSGKGIVFEWALSKKGLAVWGTSNLQHEGKLKVVLTSLPGGVPYSGTIILEGDVFYKNHYVYLTEFKISSGHDFVQGHYQVLVKSEEKGANKNISVSSAYLGTKNREEFEHHLLQYNKKLQEIKKQDLSLLQEKYQTVEKLISLLLDFSLKKTKNVPQRKVLYNQIREFYAAHISPLLSQIALGTKREDHSLYFLGTPLLREHYELIGLCKKLSLLFSEFSEKPKETDLASWWPLELRKILEQVKTKQKELENLVKI